MATTERQAHGSSPQAGTALAARSSTALDLTKIASEIIRTPQELAERVRAWQANAHILSPAIAVSNIASGYAVNVAAVVIDPTFDERTGAGPEVYHQGSIHGANEVSLGKVGLLKLSRAAGISWDPAACRRLDDGHVPYYWVWTSAGELIDFDGRVVRLPPGSVEIDLRDGSPQIGGWTPEKWAERVADAAKKSTKVVPIGGWTEDRLMSARRFGVRLAEAKSLNACTRGLGIRQKYTVAELAKPFIALRCSPDLSDPTMKRLSGERAFGASALLYRSRASEPDVIDVTPSRPAEQEAAAGNGRSVPGTPAGPACPDELAGLPAVEPSAIDAEIDRVYHITFVGQRPNTSPQVYVVRTEETGERELETVERGIALAAKHAKDAAVGVHLSYEHAKDADRERWGLLELQSIAQVATATAPAPLTVTDVLRKSGTTPAKGTPGEPGYKAARPWTRCAITFSDGRTGITFDTKTADEADAAKAAGAPVSVRTESSEKYPDQLDLAEFSVIDTRQQTLPMDDRL